MDNGLIFPYRRRTAHTNLVILTVRIRLTDPFGVRLLGLARDLSLVR